MGWCRQGTNPFSEAMSIKLPDANDLNDIITHIYVRCGLNSNRLPILKNSDLAQIPFIYKKIMNSHDRSPNKGIYSKQSIKKIC